MRHAVNLIDRLTGAVGIGGAVLVLPLFSVMVWEVVARFFFDLPTFWAYELAYMLTGAHFSLGIAYVLRRREHIRIDFLYARFPPRLRAGIDLAVYLCFLIPLAWWMSWWLGKVAWTAFLDGEVSGESGWNPVIWPLRAAVAAGFALFALQLLAEAVKTARLVFGAHEEPRA